MAEEDATETLSSEKPAIVVLRTLAQTPLWMCVKEKPQMPTNLFGFLVLNSPQVPSRKPSELKFRTAGVRRSDGGERVASEVQKRRGCSSARNFFMGAWTLGPLPAEILGDLIVCANQVAWHFGIQPERNVAAHGESEPGPDS